MSEPQAAGRVQAPLSAMELEGEADLEERMCLTGCPEVSPPRRGSGGGWRRRETLDEKLVVEGGWLGSLC